VKKYKVIEKKVVDNYFIFSNLCTIIYRVSSRQKEKKAGNNKDFLRAISSTYHFFLSRQAKKKVSIFITFYNSYLSDHLLCNSLKKY
jgi:hypothetical protein